MIRCSAFSDESLAVLYNNHTPKEAQRKLSFFHWGKGYLQYGALLKNLQIDIKCVSCYMMLELVKLDKIKQE